MPFQLTNSTHKQQDQKKAYKQQTGANSVCEQLAYTFLCTQFIPNKSKQTG